MLKVTSCSFWRLVSSNMLTATSCSDLLPATCWMLLVLGTRRQQQVEHSFNWFQLVAGNLLLHSSSEYMNIHEYDHVIDPDTRDENGGRIRWCNRWYLFDCYCNSSFETQKTTVRPIVLGSFMDMQSTSTRWLWGSAERYQTQWWKGVSKLLPNDTDWLWWTIGYGKAIHYISGHKLSEGNFSWWKTRSHFALSCNRWIEWLLLKLLFHIFVQLVISGSRNHILTMSY